MGQLADVENNTQTAPKLPPTTAIGDKLTLAMVPAPMHHGNEGSLAVDDAEQEGPVTLSHASSGAQQIGLHLSLSAAPILAVAIVGVPCNRQGLEHANDQILIALQRAEPDHSDPFLRTGANLQTAINNAKSGRHPGEYAEPVSVFHRRRHGPVARWPREPDAAGSDAGVGTSLGTVVSTVDAVVTLTNLLITGGQRSPNFVTNSGGGINSVGVLTLNGNTQVTGNTSLIGGGIASEGDVTLNASAEVNNNTASYGGGIYDLGGSVTLNGKAQVDNNGGGGLLVTLNSTHVSNERHGPSGLQHWRWDLSLLCLSKAERFGSSGPQHGKLWRGDQRLWPPRLRGS